MSKHIYETKRTSGTHQSITDYHFRDDQTAATEWKTKAQGVDFVKSHPGATKVSGAGTEAQVYVHENTNGSDFLQTISDGKWADNLLALPVIK